MAITTRYPKYPIVTANHAIGGVPIQSVVGHRRVYDDELIVIPPTLTGGQTSSTYQSFANKYLTYDFDFFKSGVVESNKLTYPYSTYNPFTDAIHISGFNIANFTDFNSRVNVTFLCTINGNTLACFLKPYFAGGGLSIQLQLGSIVNGTTSIYESMTLVQLAAQDVGVTDQTGALSFLNSCIPYLTDIYVTPQSGASGEVNIVTQLERLHVGAKFAGYYMWTWSTFGGNYIFFTDTGETTNDGGTPEPTPPEPPTPSTDPYSGGGYSGTGGGQGTGGTGHGGNYDDSSDPIPVPSLPTNIATGTGLFSAYNPSASQLSTFANKLWNRDPTTVDDWFRLLFGGDAFNAIIGLSMIPVAPDTSGNSSIKLGNWDTGATAPKISNQYKTVDFGTVSLSEYWGNCIDYSPYTRVQLALPYIGIVDVDTDDVIGSDNNLVYHIDVFSGALCAMLHCSKGNLSSVIYQWSGSCGVNLPVTGASFNAVISSVAGIAAAAAGTFALASGPIGAAIGPVGSTLVGSGMLAGAAANAYGSTKGRVQKSGAFSANSGALGIMTPYFIITRPVQSVPATWQATKGYPANISADLSTITGYTEVSEVHLHNIPGTKDEVLEIESLLKKGVIF